MAETEKLQKLKSLLQQIWDMFAEHGTAEYARGEKAAIERILQAAQSEPQDTTETPTPTPTPRPQHRRRERLRGRAPSGTAPALVDRVLAERGMKGASASEILGAAENPTERLVSYSGIRFALAQGREKGRYRNRSGKWFLNRSAEQAA